MSKDINGGWGSCSNDSRLYFLNHEILTIRIPHRGSKESRDIVAMLGREHLRMKRQFNKLWIQSNFNNCLLESFGVSLLWSYKKAKSMLK